VRALGRYELLRPIARGGMAEVYLARRRVAGIEKRLVIKRIRAERASDPAFLELFVREARLSMRLAHQNIVPVFDFGRAGGDVFLAMEYVEGVDVGAAIARGRLEPLVAAFIAAECCQALDYAHRRGDGDPGLAVVHRDVTPRNVLLSWSGEVKLADFGVASAAGDSGLRGTPAYMAPEQARGEPVDGRGDLYGLGLVLREMVTGRRARTGRDVGELLDEARRGELPPLPPEVDPRLAAIITRATAHDPADRHPDARALLDDLDAFMVAARSAEPAAPAPARRLEAWLAGMAAARPAAPADEALGTVVTFLDDDQAVADTTARSIAETQAEPPAPAPREPAAPAGRRRRALPWIAAAVVAIGAAVGSQRWVGPPAPAMPAPAAGDRATEARAAVVVRPPPTAPTAGPPTEVAAPVALRAEPAVTAAPRRRPPRRAEPASPPATPPPTRRVTIGATPWAYFRVDDDPVQHQTPEAIQLTPGRHTVHFTNPELRVERVIVLEVPADRDLRHVEPMVPRRP
jgi:tRNA A-37 threonylcarbamoyl transferase component Bud32